MLAISVLAAPLVVPPAVVIAPGLVVYGLAERLVSLVRPTRPDQLVLPVPGHSTRRDYRVRTRVNSNLLSTKNACDQLTGRPSAR